MVDRSDSFDLITSSNNTQDSRSAANIAQLTVCARTTATHSFHVVARMLGHINFTVRVINLLTYLLTYLRKQCTLCLKKVHTLSSL